MAELSKEEVRRRIGVAKADLAIAERELEVLLRTMATVDRAEKQMISDALRVAFEKLREAKSVLEQVEI